MDVSTFRVGNDKQHAFALRLAQQAGYASLADACADALGIDPSQVSKDSVDVPDASRVIAHLQVKTEASGAKKSDRTRKTMFLTARQLRRIATGDQRRPEVVDDDAMWVLDLLAKALAIGGLFSDTPAGKGVNRNEPIAIEHVLAYYRNWDELAKAFGVTVATAKAWGKLLPSSRAYEAEARTGGYVRAPREPGGLPL